MTYKEFRDKLSELVSTYASENESSVEVDIKCNKTTIGINKTIYSTYISTRMIHGQED